MFPDLTRPMPNRTVLPPLLAELARCGVPDERITLLCATGTHRQATPAEMEELVGPEIVRRYAIVDHDATSSAHVAVGEVDGVPVLLQRDYVEADLRIVTGFVEPHFFAGFSGGPKAVCPGLAASRDHPGGTPPAPHCRRPGHLRDPDRATRCTTSCGPPPRWPRRTSPSTSPSTGPVR